MHKSYIFFGIILSIILSLFVFQQINLTTADIGRHIMNGKVFIHSAEFGISKNTLLHTNFFSFTHPDFPFINHHWASGILSYFVFSLFGFMGLSLIYGFLIILATFLLFYLWKDKLPIYLSFPVVLFLVPLIAERTEVRPEAISYLFIAIIISLLYLFTNKEISKKWLYLIPVISLIWVNTHIYFIFAPFFVGLFIIETFVHKRFDQTRNLLFVLTSSIVALCINPYWIKGLLYPFTIFQNYGYLVVENQSIPFLEHLNIVNPNFLWWKIATIIFVTLSVLVLWKHKSKFPISLFVITMTFAFFSFLGIRHLTAYGLTLIPTLLCLISILYSKPVDKNELFIHKAYAWAETAIIFVAILVMFNTRLPWNTFWGVGLMSTVNASADFVKEQNIKGPIFSNYDIGGYLIFHMYPSEKVFVDNRPEAYPRNFLQNEYVAMQDSETIWNEQLSKWDFNVIWFNRNDLTPWAQKFLVTRINDPLWAPVFVDNYTIIFLQRNKKSAMVIEQYELPKSMFVVK